MIQIDTDVSWFQLNRFYHDRMLLHDTNDEAPDFSEADKGLVRDIRTSYKSGALTNNELDYMMDRIDEQDARAFLIQLASNPASRDLKLQLAGDGIGLSDHSDVGDGKRFNSFGDKATYIKTNYAFLIAVIFPSVIAYGGWGFANMDDVLGDRKPDLTNNTPGARDALRVNVPVDDGGTSSVKIGSINIADLAVEV